MLSKAPHKEDIKAAIRKKGSTLAAVSLNAGLNEGTGSNALNRPILRANRAIAKFLGVSLNQLWPNWYDENDQRISSSASGKATRKLTSRHCQKSKLDLTEHGDRA